MDQGVQGSLVRRRGKLQISLVWRPCACWNSRNPLLCFAVLLFLSWLSWMLLGCLQNNSCLISKDDGGFSDLPVVFLLNKVLNVLLKYFSPFAYQQILCKASLVINCMSPTDPLGWRRVVRHPPPQPQLSKHLSPAL